MTSMYGQIAEDSLMNDFNSTNILILIDAEKDKVLQSMNENISYDDSKHCFLILGNYAMKEKSYLLGYNKLMKKIRGKKIT